MQQNRRVNEQVIFPIFLSYSDWKTDIVTKVFVCYLLSGLITTRIFSFYYNNKVKRH